MFSSHNHFRWTRHGGPSWDRQGQLRGGAWHSSMGATQAQRFWVYGARGDQNSDQNSPAQTTFVPEFAEVDDEENRVQRRRKLEAVLLLHRGPATLRKLAQLAGLADATEARTLLRQLNDIYDKNGSAIRAEEVAGGYQLLTRAALAPWLRRFASAPQAVRLSTPAMETLSIIAYRQPILRADVEAIRGVACGEILRQLMQRDLVRICGRSEDLGRPYLYGTTKYFLETFGLKDLNALPTMTGAGVGDDTEDTCANLSDQDQAEPSASPIVPTKPLDNLPIAFSSIDAVTQKESDVSTVCVLDELCPSELANQFGELESNCGETVVAFPVHAPRAADDDDDDYYDDEEEDEDEDDDVADDDDEDEDWDDDDDEIDDAEDEEVEEEDVEDEWEEVGDDEEEEDEEDADEEDEDEDEEWDDSDDEDDDWDDDDEEDEEDEEEWD